MPGPDAHAWTFKARFRRHAFGWRSQPAVTRVKQAIAEIGRVAKKDPVLGAEGAVVFLERVSPAIERVDSSSGSLGSAVGHAIRALVPIVAAAPVDAKRREAWLVRLWDAFQDDEIPYLESLGEHWGELCASKETASSWADGLVGAVRMAWEPDPKIGGFLKGATAALSCLLAAERHDDVLALLALERTGMWCCRQFGVRALAAKGRVDEAIHHAGEARSAYDDPVAIARTCEEILLAAGRADEAYARFGPLAATAGTHLATFRALAKRYPSKAPQEILTDLARRAPGDEGKWFAAAKEAGLYDTAIALASRSPCDPKTLTRAARDFAEENPAFAVEAGLLALTWLAKGYGYEVTGGDVLAAHASTLRAAGRLGTADAVRARIRRIVAAETCPDAFLRGVLAGLLSR